MEPKRPYDGNACIVRFANGGVQVRQQAITQLQVFPTDRFDVGIVEFPGIVERRVPMVSLELGGTVVSGVPAPGQPQLPRSTVRAEERAEGAELKPTHIQLAGKLLRGYEPAGIGPPKRHAAEACVEPNGDLGPQGFPGGIDVAGPQPAVALKPGVTVAVERVGANVGALDRGTFPIHAVAHEARGWAEVVAFVRPPAVDTQAEDIKVRGPVARRVVRWPGRSAGVAHLSV